MRVPRAGEGLRADQLLLAQVDLRLIPELDPAIAQGLIEIDAGGKRGRMPELELLQDLQDGARLERLFERRQHLQTVLLTDALDVFEHGGAAAAHQLHVAAVAAAAERDHAFDGVGGFQRDVEEHDIGSAAAQRGAKRLAVGEFLGVDAGAVQDERQEMPDAAVAVDDEAQGRAPAAVMLLGVARGRARRR